MQRHIASLPISNELKQKLARNGIESFNELTKLKPTDLIKGNLNIIMSLIFPIFSK
jgi:hypothetical protein